MQVIQAHRQRVGELQGLYSRLMGQELKLFESRSHSWALQLRGASTREADLAEVGSSIAGTEMELEYLRDLLRDFDKNEVGKTPSSAVSPADDPDRRTTAAMENAGGDIDDGIEDGVENNFGAGLSSGEELPVEETVRTPSPALVEG